MRYLFVIVLMIMSTTSSAQTGQFCFTSAETYYEQVYCQLQARAQTKNLPPFHQFRKNTEDVQYSLLKRLAERNSIKFPPPVKKTISREQKVAELPVLPQSTPAKPVSPQSRPAEKIIAVEPGSSTLAVITGESVYACELSGKELHCGAQKFYLVGNKANHRLDKEALTVDNKMLLPDYEGGDLNQYLSSAYQRYIVKMCDIGLGGVTMTYKKFAYLYQDLRSKGLNFSQRFETMYGFLKKDKSSMGVGEAVSLPAGMQASLCSPLGHSYYVCDLQGRNYLFELR